MRWKIFDQDDAAIGKRAEASKRRGILDLLYTARMNQPAHPVMTIHELEDLLGCPREHLEFSLWYLRENAFIVRSDNGRFHITAKGVDRAEDGRRGPYGQRPAIDRQAEFRTRSLVGSRRPETQPRPQRIDHGPAAHQRS